MIVHWDGKLLLDLTGKQNVDRLAILVSCQAETQLLCIPKLPSGTGEAQASAVCDAIKQWGPEKNIQAYALIQPAVIPAAQMELALV